MFKKKEDSISAAATTPADFSDNLYPLDRRRFLSLATLGSAAIALASRFAHGTTESATRADSALPAYAAFHSLAPGAVKPEGWLQLYLQKQARELAIHLPEVSWPFSGPYWSGEEDRPDPRLASGNWWPWEQKAYWVDGALS